MDYNKVYTRTWFMAQKHPLEKFFTSRISIMVLVGFLIFIVIAIGGNIFEYRSYQKELAKHRETIDQLSQDNLQLSDLLTYLNSEEAVDTYARTRLGFKQVGERAFIITEDTVETTSRVDGIELDTEKNIHKWYRYYFSK